MEAAVHVGADLDRPVVGRAVAVRAAVCVADDATVDFGYKPHVGLADSLGHRVGRWGLGLERDRAIGYVRLVDRGAGRGVLLGVGVADRQAAAGPSSSAGGVSPPSAASVAGAASA